jgi:AraC family transcriptional regulator
MAKGWATFLHPEPDAVCVGISKIKSRSRLCTCPYLKIRSTQSQARSRTNTALGKISSIAISAIQSGLPDFYAQSAAQWIAAHLLLGPSAGSRWHQSLAHERISDRRIVRVLEYIEAHLGERLSLDVLAEEAAVSKFHFASVFSKSVGATPHRHVQHLRMEAAAGMLRDTDKSVLDIALTCGFQSASHFAATFRSHFAQSPSEYRGRRRTLPISSQKNRA